MANIVDPDHTAPIEAVCSGSTLFASMLNSSVMLGNYLQQHFQACIFFLLLLGLVQISHAVDSIGLDKQKLSL